MGLIGTQIGQTSLFGVTPAELGWNHRGAVRLDTVIGMAERKGFRLPDQTEVAMLHQLAVRDGSVVVQQTGDQEVLLAIGFHPTAREGFHIIGASLWNPDTVFIFTPKRIPK